MSNEKRICVGVIASPHGVRGHFKLKTFTENAENIFDFTHLMDAEGAAVDLKPVGQSGGALTATIEGIADRNAAEQLRGTKLYVTRDMLPKTAEGEFYVEDLTGLSVIIADGREVGTVKHVANYGGGDVVEVAFNNGTEEMYLFNDDNFPQVDIVQGYVQLNAPEMVEAKKK